MSFKILKSHAKINLHLGILKRLKNNLHKIESVVYFIDLHDKIYVKRIYNKEHQIKFYGKFSQNINKTNTITKLLKILDKKKFLNNRKYLIKINKRIPQKSGMGGGSINAAVLLKYFLKFRKVNDKREIQKICSEIGSDVALGMKKNPLILKSDGSITRLRKRKKFYLTLIKPNFGCSTSFIYRNVKKYSKPFGKFNKMSKKFIFKKFKNDLEEVAFKKYPKLNQIKEDLLNLPNIKFARMTGSGSSIIGYFSNEIDAYRGTKILTKKYKIYWCISSKTI